VIFLQICSCVQFIPWRPWTGSGPSFAFFMFCLLLFFLPFFSQTHRRTVHLYIKKKRKVQNRPLHATTLVVLTHSTPRQLRPQTTQPFCTSYAPQPGIILDVLDDPWGIGGGLFENTSIVVFPQPPCCLETISSAARHHSWKTTSLGPGVHCCSPTSDNT
jgi:hypothetical protein